MAWSSVPAAYEPGRQNDAYELFESSSSKPHHPKWRATPAVLWTVGILAALAGLLFVIGRRQPQAAMIQTGGAAVATVASDALAGCDTTSLRATLDALKSVRLSS